MLLLQGMGMIESIVKYIKLMVDTINMAGHLVRSSLKNVLYAILHLQQRW